MYIPAIEGYVPAEMVCTLSAFLDCFYLVRRNSITSDGIEDFRQALGRFHQHHEIFETAGVRPVDQIPPRQHSLVHYARHIRDYGAPNGLCSSITESKHIDAVKKPWRRSNRFNALRQMLVTNERIDKLSFARANFKKRRMLEDALSGIGVSRS